MFGPLVLPERLVVAVDINPVLVHVGKQVVFALVLQDAGDVAVGTRRVAARLEGAIAVVWPRLSCVDH